MEEEIRVREGNASEGTKLRIYAAWGTTESELSKIDVSEETKLRIYAAWGTTESELSKIDVSLSGASGGGEGDADVDKTSDTRKLKPKDLRLRSLLALNPIGVNTNGGDPKIILVRLKHRKQLYAAFLAHHKHEALRLKKILIALRNCTS